MRATGKHVPEPVAAIVNSGIVIRIGVPAGAERLVAAAGVEQASEFKICQFGVVSVVAAPGVEVVARRRAEERPSPARPSPPRIRSTRSTSAATTRSASNSSDSAACSHRTVVLAEAGQRQTGPADPWRRSGDETARPAMEAAAARGRRSGRRGHGPDPGVVRWRVRHRPHPADSCDRRPGHDEQRPPGESAAGPVAALPGLPPELSGDRQVLGDTPPSVPAHRPLRRRLVWLNLLLLMLVSFLPFPTAVLGQHYCSPAAAVLYASSLCWSSCASTACWWYASGRGGLLRPHVRRAHQGPACEEPVGTGVFRADAANRGVRALRRRGDVDLRIPP